MIDVPRSQSSAKPLPSMMNLFKLTSARGSAPGCVSVRSISGLMKSFLQGNEKRKRDPHTPALRSKGEKARNRHNRLVK